MPHQDVETYLRNLHTTDETRAEAWDAVYASDDPAEIQDRLSKVKGLTDRLRGQLWEARFPTSPEEEEQEREREKQERTTAADAVPIEQRTLEQAGQAAPAMVEAYKDIAPYMVIPPVVGAIGRAVSPLVGPAVRAVGTALENPAVGATLGAYEGGRRGGLSGAMQGGILGGVWGYGMGRALRTLGTRLSRPSTPPSTPALPPDITKGMSAIGGPAYANRAASDRMIAGMGQIGNPPAPPVNVQTIGKQLGVAGGRQAYLDAAASDRMVQGMGRMGASSASTSAPRLVRDPMKEVAKQGQKIVTDAAKRFRELSMKPILTPAESQEVNYLSQLMKRQAQEVGMSYAARGASQPPR